MLLANLVLSLMCEVAIVGLWFTFSFFSVGMHREHPGHATETDKEVSFGHAHALAGATSIAELTVAGDCREFGQWLLVGWIFVLQPTHRVPDVRLIEDLGIARYRPFERMHYRTCRDVVAFVDVVLD